MTQKLNGRNSSRIIWKLSSQNTRARIKTRSSPGCMKRSADSRSSSIIYRRAVLFHRKKKTLKLSLDDRLVLVDPFHQSLSIRQQCALLGIPRSSWYYTPFSVEETTPALMHAIDRQCTKTPFYGRLIDAIIRISMDGKGRALDNVFVVRLWRSVKYEDVYLNNYSHPNALREGLRA